MSKMHVSQPSQALARAIRRMLRPLVKLLMHQGITYMGLIEVLKETYVEVAERDGAFHLDNKRQTDSRISLLTGVHRGEVKRLRAALDEQPGDKEIRAGIGAQIMARWLGHPDYQDIDGRPLALERSGDDARSFETLVFEVSRDKHPRSILDDWVKQGLVELDEDNRIHLRQQGYTAGKDVEEKLFFAGKNIAEHLDTVSHNLTRPDDPRFERALYYHRLSQQSVGELEDLARTELLGALTRINRAAAEKQQQDKDLEATAEHSVHVGAYLSKSGGEADGD